MHASPSQNSWDRQPYAWRGHASTDVTLLPIRITRNLVINNYNSVW